MNSRESNNHLDNHKMFSVLKKGLSDKITKTQNIVVCKDDVLYVWHAAENCILTLHMKTFELEENTDFQDCPPVMDAAHLVFNVHVGTGSVDSIAHTDHTLNVADLTDTGVRLLPTEAPNFTVDKILVNPLSTLLLLVGPKGICVLRLPRRSGALSLFQGGRPTVLCKSQMVDERFFLTQCDIYQLTWHPGSNSDAHILVLCSDNTLRLYDLAGPSSDRIAIFPLGKRSTALAQTQMNTVLGDNIVAFTFGRPFIKNQSENKTDQRKEIEWPVLLLKGTGDVCMIDGSIYNRSTPPAVIGPLPIYPPADDNYGVESCSILQLGSHLIAIATCGGILYHCILLPQDSDEEKDVTKSIHGSPKHSLYVMEAIELDLGLNLGDNDQIYSCPVYLIPDEGVKNRYFCAHEAGIHLITVPIVNQLEEFFNAKDDDVSFALPPLNYPSTAEYAVCTKTCKSNAVNPPLGLTVSYSPHAFLTILSNGDVVRRPLGTEPGSELLFTEAYLPKDKNTTESELSLSLKEMQKVSFENHIRQMLKQDQTQPILKMANNTDCSPQECFELMSHATHIFHEEYLTKLERARKEIERRVATLRLLKEHQMLESRELLKGVKDVMKADGNVRQKCNDLVKKQQELNQRCSKVLHGIRIKHSVSSIAEKDMMVELKNAQNKTYNFTKQMENVNKKIHFREQQMREWDSNKSKKEILLGKNHMEIIKSTMEKQTDQIKEIMSEVNHLKLDLSLL